MSTDLTHNSSAADPFEEADMPLFHDLSNYPQLDVEALRELANDPETAKKIVAAQTELFAHIDKMADALSSDLVQYEQKDSIAFGNATAIRRLSMVSRQAATEGKSRRELAKQLLIASIINYGNLDWNPADPSTSWSVEQNPSTLLSLLMLGPVNVPAGQGG
ncbi:hypothetical protein EGT07_17255 [Herbaspirillum sp. HC18]|nr:hypothetical protein EGT07_17255 [Herbaspirillum sp. HC18]